MLAAFLASAALLADPAPSPWTYFEGAWGCEGVFLPSNRPLASDIAFRDDPRSGALVKDHLDRPPGRYAATETWALAPDGKTYRAGIASSGAMRWYRSEGWKGDEWTWTRQRDAAEPEEAFAFIRQDPATMIVEWRISRNGAPMTVGDRITCHRA
jgi:hypothetical protein